MVAAAQPGGGALLANLMHFARTLRAAGLPVGPGKVIDAVAAVRLYQAEYSLEAAR